MTMACDRHGICDEISVFGFGLTTDGIWGHYYEKKRRKARWHSPHFQESFMDQLEKDGIITIYRGIEKSSKDL